MTAIIILLSLVSEEPRAKRLKDRMLLGVRFLADGNALSGSRIGSQSNANVNL